MASSTLQSSRPRKQLLLADSDGCIASDEREKRLRELSLVGIALALGARSVSGWSDAEQQLAVQAEKPANRAVARFREQIAAGDDPLGDEFCRIRLAAQRREQCATYTPAAIVSAMVDWAAEAGLPMRIIDPGSGSGRYLVAAGRRMPKAALIGVEIDPLPAILSRANLAASGFAKRAKVQLCDYRAASFDAIDGQTLFIGNPPYVRHHLLGSHWKQWLSDAAAKQSLVASQLAGLHVHFFLATAAKARQGDYGAFITAAEWLDVNYGSLVRELLLGSLGGKRIDVVEPTALPFPDAATTAAIAYFEIGAKPNAIRLSRVDSLNELKVPGNSHIVKRDRLLAERRWSHLTRPARKGPSGYIELGELCRVHRGQVTGLNKVWIAGEHSVGLPECVLFPTITKARELFSAGRSLENAEILRCVIDLPAELDVLDSLSRQAVDRFLKTAKRLGADLGHVAKNRTAWWSVGLRQPAPILATYMARRPPAFVHNHARARHINIAHGIYPREPLSQIVLNSLVNYLSQAVRTTQGRTYAGGLTKFEPREMERILIPGIELLMTGFA